MRDVHAELQRRKECSLAAGGTKRIEAQHAKGKLTARERLEILFDTDSFEELGSLVEHRCAEFGMAERRIPGDGVICGWGRVNGRVVYAYAKDFTVFGGTLSEAHAEKITRLQSMALRNRKPIVGLYDSGGARIQEGVASLAGYGEVFQQHILASGVIPQISLIMGPCAGGDVYAPALTDFIFMVRGIASLFVTGPEVVRAVTGEVIDAEKLGGADVHTGVSGVADEACNDDIELLIQTRRLLDFLPADNRGKSPGVSGESVALRSDMALDTLVPDLPDQPYDMRDLIHTVVDHENFFEIQKKFAANIMIGFARMDGRSVGIVGNQPDVLAGVLDCDASRKAARFVRFCDCFNIPIVTFVDVPGFLPGTDQEQQGLICHGAKLLFAFGEASVPKVTVITRKAFGGAYDVMSSKHLGADINYAWPSAQIAVMGARGAVRILYRDEVDSESENMRVKQYEAHFLSPFVAAQRGFIDEVISPHSTRNRIIGALSHLETKTEDRPWKKHDNLPL